MSPVIVTPKSPWASSTLWVNVLTFAGVLITWLIDYRNPDGSPFIPVDVYPVLLMIVNVANTFIRLFLTKAPLNVSVPTEAPRVSTGVGVLKRLS